jgi:SHS2 domain-containing protein
MPVVQSGFELFDHTADLGLRIRAADLPGLIPPATQALYAAIGELHGAGEPVSFAFELTSTDAAGLLRDYLTELLHLFEHDAKIVTNCEVREFNQHRLHVVGTTQIIDRQRTALDREVKEIGRAHV